MEEHQEARTGDVSLYERMHPSDFLPLQKGTFQRSFSDVESDLGQEAAPSRWGPVQLELGLY